MPLDHPIEKLIFRVRARANWPRKLVSHRSNGSRTPGFSAIFPERLHMRHFADLRPIDRLGGQADFSLSHGAVQLAAEQLLEGIRLYYPRGRRRQQLGRSRLGSWLSPEGESPGNRELERSVASRFRQSIR